MVVRQVAGSHRSHHTSVFGFLAANLISDLGNSFSMLAIPWFVLATGGSASQTGIVVAAGVIPSIAVGILGGAIVDRLGPKRAAIASDLMSAIAVAAVPLLHTTVGIAFWQLIALSCWGPYSTDRACPLAWPCFPTWSSAPGSTPNGRTPGLR